MCPQRGYLTMEAIANSPTTFGVCQDGSPSDPRGCRPRRASPRRMQRRDFGQTGVSLPAAGDGVQTVSDAADALDAHRSSAHRRTPRPPSRVTDALGSFVRDISADQRALALAAASFVCAPAVHFVRQYMIEKNGKRILTGSELRHAQGSDRHVTIAKARRAIACAEFPLSTRPSAGRAARSAAVLEPRVNADRRLGRPAQAGP